MKEEATCETANDKIIVYVRNGLGGSAAIITPERAVELASELLSLAQDIERKNVRRKRAKEVDKISSSLFLNH